MAKSRFSELFEHYDDLYGALKVVVERDYEKSGSVDPAEVVRELLAAKPDISLSPADFWPRLCKRLGPRECRSWSSRPISSASVAERAQKAA